VLGFTPTLGQSRVATTMQSKVWMTNQLCANWIVYFVMPVNDGMDYIFHLSL
jgi:hypothetical protein